MTGPEHYREADRLLSLEGLGAGDDPRDPVIIAAAQVHATLALAAASAAPQVDRWLGDESRQGHGWTEVTR